MLFYYTDCFLCMREMESWHASVTELYIHLGGNTMLSITAVTFDVLRSMRLVLFSWILLKPAYLTSSSAMQIVIIMKCLITTPRACLLCLTMARGIQKFQACLCRVTFRKF